MLKLKGKNVLFREINIMKNSLKQVNLDSSITIAKSKLDKNVHCYYTEFIIH